MNKTLAEYVGVCWHEQDFEHPVGRRTHCMHCNAVMMDTINDVLLTVLQSPDFTDPDGWQLIADKISESGEWKKLYRWLCKADFVSVYMLCDELATFHEKQPADKSKIVYEAITAGVIGGKS